MTMKDKLASYNHLIETFVIVTETFLCGLLFLLFSKLSNEMQWDSLQVGGITVLQIMLTLMLCYALCAIHSGVVLHRRKVHSLQIWKRVLENMFLFVLLGGLVLSVGNYADIASLVHVGVPFSPVYVSCFVPFHSSSSHQALPYEQETYAFCGTGRKYGQQLGNLP
jgi:hypothetical protein